MCVCVYEIEEECCISQGSPEKQIGDVCECVCVCVCREIYFQEMAFMIMGAWQVQNLMGKTSRLDI